MLSKQEIEKVLNTKIKVDLVPERLWPYKCTYPMRPEYVTIHNAAYGGPVETLHDYGSTCCLDPALQNIKSWHLSVGESLIIQMLPFNRNSWQAGDGSGPGNRKSISIEICRDLPVGSKLYYEAEKNGAKAAAWLLYIYKWGTDRLRTHYDWSRKNCPHRILNEHRWEEFKTMVATFLRQLTNLKSSKKKEPSRPSFIYRLQLQPMRHKSSALYHQHLLRKSGFAGLLVFANGFFSVQIGAFTSAAAAQEWAKRLKQKGFHPRIVKVNREVITA